MDFFFTTVLTNIVGDLIAGMLPMTPRPSVPSQPLCGDGTVKAVLAMPSNKWVCPLEYGHQPQGQPQPQAEQPEPKQD